MLKVIAASFVGTSMGIAFGGLCVAINGDHRTAGWLLILSAACGATALVLLACLPRNP